MSRWLLGLCWRCCWGSRAQRTPCLDHAIHQLAGQEPGEAVDFGFFQGWGNIDHGPANRFAAANVERIDHQSQLDSLRRLTGGAGLNLHEDIRIKLLGDFAHYLRPS